MEQLQINHIAPYLPYGLKYQGYYGGVSTMRDIKHIRDYNEETDEYTPNIQVDGYTIEFIKPLLHPLSDLYKEIDGEVGIVEIAKMLSGTVLVDKIDGCCTNLSYFKCTFEDYGFEELIINENCEGWYRSYFDKNQPSTGRNVINQFEVFTYLFQHHYDVFGLIDKGLAIDLNKNK